MIANRIRTRRARRERIAGLVIDLGSARGAYRELAEVAEVVRHTRQVETRDALAHSGTPRTIVYAAEQPTLSTADIEDALLEVFR